MLGKNQRSSRPQMGHGSNSNTDSHDSIQWQDREQALVSS